MIAPRDLYGRQGGRWADGDTPDMDDIRAAADDWPTVPCPGCDGQGGLPRPMPHDAIVTVDGVCILCDGTGTVARPHDEPDPDQGALW